jgi:hypothetical protein
MRGIFMQILITIRFDALGVSSDFQQSSHAMIILDAGNEL